MAEHKSREKLTQMRKERGLSLQQMANKLEITKPYLWQIEKGKRGLSYNLAVRIASVFETTPDEIFLSSKLTKTEQSTA